MHRSFRLALLLTILPPMVAGAVTDAAEAKYQAAAEKVETAPDRAPPSDDQVDLRVRTLEERVNEVKEKVFRTKARLLNLQEMVVGGDLEVGAKAVVVHRNEMGASFVLDSATYTLDGAPVYSKVDQDGDLDKRPQLEVFSGRVAPGIHRLGVRLTYRGHGSGVFSNLEAYRFTVESAFTFDAQAGLVTTVRAVGFEKGGLTTDLKDRPAIRWDVVAKREPKRPAAAAAGGASQ